MSRVIRALSGLVQTVITFAVLIILGTLAFYVTVFVVSTGAGLAGYENVSGDFVVLSAALLVVAALLGGIPLGHTPQPSDEDDRQPSAGFE
ncbi:hypothetical protein [Natronomonas amylolytica]|uniref:hypothetical protein n=1 Tax=Natronomonas amylolytica TaxID=3108498 RepID=UPI00300B9C5B